MKNDFSFIFIQEKGDEANLPSARNILASLVSLLASNDARLLQFDQRITELEGRLTSLTNHILKRKELIDNYQLGKISYKYNGAYKYNIMTYTYI